MGGQKGIALFYKYLAAFVQLTCLTIKSNSATEKYEVLNVLPNASSRYINPFVYFQVRKYIQQKQITHILFEHPYYAWLIMLIQRTTRCKVIVHAHNIEAERFKSIGKAWWKLLWYYERLAFSKADQIWFKTSNDRLYDQQVYQLPSLKCKIIPYGVELDQIPANETLAQACDKVKHRHAIHKEELVVLFNGTLSYKPNLDALMDILQEINPRLIEKNIPYKIIICGRSLPEHLQKLEKWKEKNIIYCGFVEDIDEYFMASDIFLNPLTDGGGIKTKLVEALGFGKLCISSVNGAIGVDAAYTNGRLVIVEDGNWNAYINAIITWKNNKLTDDNHEFYKYFAWKNIANLASKFVEEL